MALASGFSQNCEIQYKCRACAFVNFDYRKSLQQKYDVEFKKIEPFIGRARQLGVTGAAQPMAYRCAAKLVVRRDPRDEKKLAFGLYEPGTHNVVDITTCGVHAASIAHILPILKTELENSTLAPYDEATGTGDLRYIALRASHLTEELMITFVVNRPCKNELQKIVQNLRRMEYPTHSNIVAAFMNVNCERGNVIFGSETVPLGMGQHLREKLCGIDFEVGPLSFFQINPWMAESLYRRLTALVGTATKSAVAWDLYCGIGQISLNLTKMGFRVLGVEEIGAAVQDALKNARKNHFEKEATFVSGRVEDILGDVPAWSQNPDVIVVNPSRRGIAPEARTVIAEKLAHRPDTRLIYVSCEAETLGRDLEDFVARGLTVRQVEAFDMFPNTHKLEWIAVLQPKA